MERALALPDAAAGGVDAAQRLAVSCGKSGSTADGWDAMKSAARGRSRRGYASPATAWRREVVRSGGLRPGRFRPTANGRGHGDNHEQLPERRLAVPLLLAVAGEDGPAHALSRLAAGHRVVAAATPGH